MCISDIFRIQHDTFFLNWMLDVVMAYLGELVKYHLKFFLGDYNIPTSMDRRRINIPYVCTMLLLYPFPSLNSISIWFCRFLFFRKNFVRYEFVRKNIMLKNVYECSLCNYYYHTKFQVNLTNYMGPVHYFLYTIAAL